jgi:uncharacterized OB-fold protein
LVSAEKNRNPIKDGLWKSGTAPDEKPQLIGDICADCGEIFFPRKEGGVCIHCQSPNLEEVRLSRKGKISSFSIVMIKPGGGFYKGPVPYAYGIVELYEGLRLKSHLIADDLEKLRLGMDVEMVIEKLWEDKEGNEIMTFMFKPIAE